MAGRRATDWIDTLVALSVATGAQVNVSLMTGVAPINVRRQTLARSIFDIGMTSASVAGAYGVQKISIGIGVVSQEAFAAGVLPDPEVAGDQPSRGWVYRTVCLVAQNGSGAQVVYGCTGDIRAMRKLDDGEMFFVATSTAVVGTTFTTSLNGIVRQLWFLP